MAGRDDIDFGTVDISKLFRKIFIPTLLGMASWSLITVADGTDAFDTLFIGCEKFPQRNFYPISTNGVL